MKELTLVVMAAGMGSRFGGLKQITPVDEENNFLIDYSIYDAIRSGFQKVVFIIKEENKADFEETIGKRLQGKIKVEYAYQRLIDVPKNIKVPENREKPWGTVHAILSAKNYIDGPFAVINADDFYGFNSYQKVAKFLKENQKEEEQISIPYPFDKVDSKYGFVKRGVLYFKEDKVKRIIECNVGYEDNKVIAKPLDGSAPFEIKKDHPVSMNMYGFHRSILKYLEEYFNNFMEEHKEDLNSIECLLTDFLEVYLSHQKITLKYMTSNGLWLGMTYKEDLESAKTKIKELKEKGEYPTSLWK